MVTAMGTDPAQTRLEWGTLVTSAVPAIRGVPAAAHRRTNAVSRPE